MLLAAMLLQRLEAALLTAPETDEHPADPAVPPLTLVPPPPDPPAPRRSRSAPGPPAARATA
ncbi:MAG TPA: hypothetical protein VD903_00260 [Pseudonocardia sp.]|nr:hypothetical protein [Pseudonocardia sp.]